MNIKTNGYSKEEKIHVGDSKHQNNEVVFSCTINEYKLEVKVIKKDSNFICFQQEYLKNNTPIDIPMWLSSSTLDTQAKKQRWLDLIFFINKLEGESLKLVEINEFGDEAKITSTKTIFYFSLSDAKNSTEREYFESFIKETGANSEKIRNDEFTNWMIEKLGVEGN
ncbi:hypothetical protein CN980_22595 [Bacillus cereus]|uniref:Uncharacterized protein n=1 Tax=Bacillus cereus TaxID=1396 RepID=A0A9X7C8S4_BACCE|nr:hypothetical protein [Bacillus cereus]PGO67668.1 hypothetical protein CN980_22595 [Bacillus cereus]